MGDEEQSSFTSTGEPPVTVNQLLELLQSLNTTKSNPEFSSHQTVTISEKLNNQNYTKWARLMHLAISGRGRLNHIIANPPPTTDPTYQKWTQTDSTVFSWIIENIESDLVNQYLDYPTSRELWQGIEAMYSSGRDGLQIFDLTVKANSLKQGSDPIEVFYSKLITIWKEIDRRMPNPMKDAEDITIYNGLVQRTRLYQFLAGVSDSLDKDRRDLLNRDPLPSVEEAYSAIRREITRRGIMSSGQEPLSGNPSGIGAGLAAKGKFEATTKSAAKPPNRKEESDKSHLKCTHCGGTKHTKDGCFKLIGYPDWWPDSKKRGTKATVAMAAGSQSTTFAIGNRDTSTGFTAVTQTEETRGDEKRKTTDEKGKSLEELWASDDYWKPTSIQTALAQSINSDLQPAQSGKICSTWLIDCGATDTMSYDPLDFHTHTKPKKNLIQTANGGYSLVEGAGSIELNPALKLKNCLYVPSLSQKLLSVSHVTKELNCVVLMHPHFCLLQDIRTGKIIGRGTERDGLYYVDEVVQPGTAMLAHGTVDRKLWLWHRRLGHPSLEYLKKLFPQFSEYNNQFSCETCILAKVIGKHFILSIQ